ncbi:polysaccharide biosynthesis/export family protein, partial [Bacteroides thetaiotaomicron]
RVKQLYEQQNNVNTSQSTGTDINESRLREETKENTSDMLEDHPTTEDLAREDQVFGRNIFNTRNLTFEPSVNLATPANYRLGPGDEVIIDIWGASQNTIRQQISPEGTINIQKIGPVNLSGMTVSAANEYLKGALNKIYNGLNNTTDPTSDIRLTLGNIRTIQINVMGEVVQPGTYALSSFSTVFHALYRAGGVSDIGSLRNVQLVRNGKNIATIDVYEFIMKGNTQDDIRLQEGDVVIVPAYDVLVKISGKVKRPMRFEMKKDENLATLIKYAGGFEADAYTRSLRVVRQNGEEYEVNTVKDMDYSIYTMRNGDVVTAEAILNRFTNKLEIRGAVYRPGIYQLSGKLNTIRELVHEAQGLTGDAFLNRAV